MDTSDTLPAISSATVVEGSDPTQVKIGGSNFGSAGSVKIAGADATVVSWQDDGIVVQLPDGLAAGVLSVAVTTSSGTVNGGYLLEFDSPSSRAVFEKDIALPKEFSTTTMDGFLVGLDDSPLVFPLDVYQTARSYYGNLWRYDEAAETWTQCSDLPVKLDTLSATVYRGQVIVAGSVFDWDSSKVTSLLYGYDPASDTWTTYDSANVPAAAAIVNANGTLMLVGGGTEIADSKLKMLESDNIATLDLDTGAVAPVGSLATSCCCPKVAASGTDVYVTQGLSMTSMSYPKIAGMQKLTESDGAYTAADISSALPRVQADTSTQDNKLHGCYSLAMLPEGPVISGVLAYADGEGTSFVDADTYVSADGGASFSDFGKRAYRSTLYYATSAVTDTWLYTMGSSVYDDDVLVLRATQIATPTPTPDPTPEPGSGDGTRTPSALPNTGDAAPTWMAMLVELFR